MSAENGTPRARFLSGRVSGEADLRGAGQNRRMKGGIPRSAGTPGLVRPAKRAPLPESASSMGQIRDDRS